MASTYHHSVRHYHAPFPMEHRNVRPLPAPESNQGPWGAAHHTDKVATSPLSANFDRRNQSRVPLSTGSADGRRTHRAVSPSASFSPDQTMMSSMSMISSPPQSPLKGGLSTSQHLDPVPVPAPYGDGNGPLQSPWVERQNDGTATTHAASTHLRSLGPQTASPSAPGDTNSHANGRPQQNAGRQASPPTIDDDGCLIADYHHLHSGELPFHGKGVGAYSSTTLQRHLASVVPDEYDAPNTLRMSYRRADSEGASGGPSPRRRAPAFVLTGYIYKSCSVNGLNAPTHVQVPMGYRPMGHRPQLAAKVTQYSPWKPMDAQAPLPTLEPKVASPSRPYSTADASLRYAVIHDESNSVHRKRVPENAITLASYTQNAAQHPPPPSSRGGTSTRTVVNGMACEHGADLSNCSSPLSSAIHPFESSRKVYRQKQESNVPMSPNQHRGGAVTHVGGGGVPPSEPSATGSPTRRMADATTTTSRTGGQSDTSYQATLHDVYDSRMDSDPANAASVVSPRGGAADDDDDRIARGRARSSPFVPQSKQCMPEGWHATSYGLPQQDPVKASGGPSPRRRAPAFVPTGYIYKSCSVNGLNAPTHVQVPMGYRPMGHRPQLAAKVTQFSPWKPMDAQAPLPTLEPSRSGQVERLAATPLIIEVDERLAAQGLGSLLDIRFSSDEKVAKVLQHLGFGASERMTILWELRRKHPLPQ